MITRASSTRRSGCATLPPVPTTPSLPLTGERTVPGVAAENYWFRRHEAAYRWLVDALPVPGAVVRRGRLRRGVRRSLLADAGAAVVAGLDLDLATVRHAAAPTPAYRSPRPTWSRCRWPTARWTWW